MIFNTVPGGGGPVCSILHADDAPGGFSCSTLTNLLGFLGAGLHVESSGNRITENVIAGNAYYNDSILDNNLYGALQILLDVGANNNQLVGNNIGYGADGDLVLMPISSLDEYNKQCEEVGYIGYGLFDCWPPIGIAVFGSNNIIGGVPADANRIGGHWIDVWVPSSSDRIHPDFRSATSVVPTGNVISYNDIGTTLTLDGYSNFDGGIRLERAGNDAHSNQIQTPRSGLYVLGTNTARENTVTGWNRDPAPRDLIAINQRSGAVIVGGDAVVRDNSISSGAWGVLLLDGLDVRVTSNEIKGTYGGLLVPSFGLEIEGGLQGTEISENTFTVSEAGQYGVVISDGEGIIVKENTITGIGAGIVLPPNPYSETAQRVLLSRNTITTTFGIDLGDDGVTLNDITDLDEGPNGLLNYPVIQQAVGSERVLLVNGLIRGAFGASYTVEVFGNTFCGQHPNTTLLHGPGETYLGTVTVETNGSDFGERAFSLLVEGLAPEHRYVTLTSSRLDLGITSEFSRCVRIASPDDVANADVDPNKTGPVLEAVDTRIIVENGDGVAKASEISSQGAVHPGGKVFATRYDSTPDSSVFAEVSATSSSGTMVSPEFVAPRHWLLVEQGLTTVSDGQTPATFSVCLAPTNAVQRNRLEEIVLLQRNEKTDGWLPHNSYLEMFEEEPYLCAGGLTELGEFGIGGAENGFNSTGEDPDLELPDMISLDQNYPNPFNPQTVIPYSLTSAGRVQIGVYDLLGRRLQTLVDAVMPAGRHQVTFDAGKLSSGIYIYQLESGSTRITQKMMLIK